MTTVKMHSYSIDLRKRVIEAVNKGMLQLKEIAALFNVNVKTIYKWRKHSGIKIQWKKKTN